MSPTLITQLHIFWSLRFIPKSPNNFEFQMNSFTTRYVCRDNYHGKKTNSTALKYRNLINHHIIIIFSNEYKTKFWSQYVSFGFNFYWIRLVSFHFNRVIVIIKLQHYFPQEKRLQPLSNSGPNCSLMFWTMYSGQHWTERTFLGGIAPPKISNADGDHKKNTGKP